MTFYTSNLFGKGHQTATIKTNAVPELATAEMTVNILAPSDTAFPAKIDRMKIDLLEYPGKDEWRSDILFENVSGIDLAPRLVESGAEYYEVKLPQKIQRGHKGHGWLKVKKEMRDSAFYKSLTIEFDDPDHTRYTIAVHRYVLDGPPPSLDAEPFSNCKPGTPAVKRD